MSTVEENTDGSLKDPVDIEVSTITDHVFEFVGVYNIIIDDANRLVIVGSEDRIIATFNATAWVAYEMMWPEESTTD